MQIHHIEEGGELVRLEINKTTPIARNKKTTAVAGCPVAKRIRKAPMATSIQNTGDSGNLPISKFMLIKLMSSKWIPQRFLVCPLSSKERATTLVTYKTSYWMKSFAHMKAIISTMRAGKFYRGIKSWQHPPPSKIVTILSQCLKVSILTNLKAGR
jgi:hypothetical protein